MPSEEQGRIDLRHHAPRCCIAHDCLAQERGDKAFVSTLRSPEYLVLLRELQCSIAKHSPGVHFIVLAVPGDLNASIIQDVQSFAEYREIEELTFPNDWFPRFSKNWFKLRAWNMTDLDSIIMLDADIVLQGDIRHLFSLPTDFAWVTDSAPGAREILSGGLIFLRPCQAIADDMLEVLKVRPELRYPSGMAEQAFLAWYFQYIGIRLPSMYNTNFQIWFKHLGQITAGGERPIALHFSDRKLFKVCPTDPEWRFLCHRPRLAKERDSTSLVSQSIPGVNCEKEKPNQTMNEGIQSVEQQAVKRSRKRKPLNRLNVNSFQIHAHRPK